MAEHTPAQWRELRDKVVAIRDNPFESIERKNQAERVIRMIARNPDAQAALRDAPPSASPTLTQLGWVEMDL